MTALGAIKLFLPTAILVLTLGKPSVASDFVDLSGVVTDSQTGKPIANSSVTISDALGRELKLLTDRHGSYHALISDGPVGIAFSRERYFLENASCSGDPGAQLRVDIRLKDDPHSVIQQGGYGQYTVIIFEADPHPADYSCFVPDTVDRYTLR
jgi:hypothetical protein